MLCSCKDFGPVNAVVLLRNDTISRLMVQFYMYLLILVIMVVFYYYMRLRHIVVYPLVLRSCLVLHHLWLHLFNERQP